MRASLFCIGLCYFLIEVIAELDYYEVLNIDRDSSTAQIKKAYRKLSLQFHPDKCSLPNPDDCKTKFQDIGEAYEVLSDDDKRRVYDSQGKQGLDRLKQQGGGGGGFDPFAQMFGFGRQQNKEDMRGPDVKIPISATLEDLFNGKTVKASYKKQAICSKCRGSGAASPKHIQQCSKCKGQGVTLEMRQIAPGFVQQVQQQCNACGGKGKIITQTCPKCNGARILPTEEEIEIDIEKGMDNNSEIVFEHEADAHPDHKSGHLIFIVKTKSHPQFTRRGNDLDLSLDITLKEALIGYEKTFIHLDGKEVEISSRSVTQPGEIKTMIGEGMPKTNDPMERGNLYIKFNIIFPESLSSNAKSIFSKIL